MKEAKPPGHGLVWRAHDPARGTPRPARPGNAYERFARGPRSQPSGAAHVSALSMPPVAPAALCHGDPSRTIYFRIDHSFKVPWAPLPLSSDSPRVCAAREGQFCYRKGVTITVALHGPACVCTSAPTSQLRAIPGGRAARRCIPRTQAGTDVSRPGGASDDSSMELAPSVRSIDVTNSTNRDPYAGWMAGIHTAGLAPVACLSASS